MKPLNSLDSVTEVPDTQVAQEMVKASVSRFENAMDQLAERVESTGSSVRQAMDVMATVKQHREAILYGLAGLVSGFLILRFAKRRLSRRSESRNLVHAYPEGDAGTWMSP